TQLSFQMDKTDNRSRIRALVKQHLSQHKDECSLCTEAEEEALQLEETSESRAASREGYFDFDLAEFPLFRFHKSEPKSTGRDPLCYHDTISGKDGHPVPREWRVYPGPFGFGGQTTQALLYDLLQLYVEQGCYGSQIQFGTLRSLFLRRGERNPSKADYV